MNFDELYNHATLSSSIIEEISLGRQQDRYAYPPASGKARHNDGRMTRDQALEARRQYIINKLKQGNFKDRSAMIKHLKDIYNKPEYKEDQYNRNMLMPPGTNLNKEFPLPKKYAHRHPLNFTADPMSREDRPHIPMPDSLFGFRTPWKDIILPSFEAGVWAHPGAPASGWDSYDQFYDARDKWGSRYWDDRGDVEDTYKMPEGDEEFDPEHWLQSKNINWKDHIRGKEKREGSFFNHNPEYPDITDFNPDWNPPKENKDLLDRLSRVRQAQQKGTNHGDKIPPDPRKRSPVNRPRKSEQQPGPPPVTADADTKPNARRDQQNLSTTYQNNVNKGTASADIFGPILRGQENEEKRKRNSSEEIDHSKEGD